MCVLLKRPTISTTDSFIKKTTANTDQIRDIEERIESLGEVLTSPMGDRDSEEKARRKALRKYVLPSTRNNRKFLSRLDYSQEVG